MNIRPALCCIDHTTNAAGMGTCPCDSSFDGNIHPLRWHCCPHPYTPPLYALPMRHTVADMIHRSCHEPTGIALAVSGRDARPCAPTNAGAGCCRHPQDDNGRRLTSGDARSGWSSAQNYRCSILARPAGGGKCRHWMALANASWCRRVIP